jgi:hypothetical protein
LILPEYSRANTDNQAGLVGWDADQIFNIRLIKAVELFSSQDNQSYGFSNYTRPGLPAEMKIPFLYVRFPTQRPGVYYAVVTAQSEQGDQCKYKTIEFEIK